MSHILSLSTPEDQLQPWVHGWHSVKCVNLHWMFYILIVIQNNITKPEWKRHGLPFYIQFFTKEWTTVPLRQKQRTHSKAKLEAVGVVYISRDKGSLCWLQRPFLLPFNMACLCRKKPSFYSYTLHMETQRREQFTHKGSHRFLLLLI